MACVEVYDRRGIVEMLDFEMRAQKPLKEIVYLELKHKILTGEIPTGKRLMEVELAKKMNVSRTPIREAIRRLADDGLVQMTERKGAYVAQISIKDMLDVFEIREDMEGFCAFLAAGRSSDEQKKRLREIAEDYHEACINGDKMKMIYLDEEFHNYIVACCNNDTLRQLVEYVQDLSLRFRYLYYEDNTLYEETAKQHLDMMEAIAAGDGEQARVLADNHVRAIKEFVFSLSKRLENGAIQKQLQQ